jgi:hypothetical protein
LGNEYVFHIRNAQPGDLAAILATLDVHPDLNTITEIVNAAELMGYSILDRTRLEALTTARDTGLITEKENTLTNQGSALTSLEMNKPDLFADIVHGLYYTLWNRIEPAENCFAWSYRTICRILWQSGTSEISDRAIMASKVESEARDTFGRADIVFSSKSVGGAYLWLSQLRPDVIYETDRRFKRRTFCPPELFIMAVDHLYSGESIDYGVNLLLNEANREEICQVCMLEPTGFDRVLEYAVAQFPYLDKGLGGGWGYYLTLQCQPNLVDFI